jgi:HEAT repeat protein
MKYALSAVLLAAPCILAPADPPATPWEILTEGAAEQNYIKRAQAIAALGTIRTPEANKFVDAAMADKELPIRLAAVSALADRKLRSDIPRLRLALEDEAGEVSFTAAKTLWEMGDRSGKELLEQVLAGERKQSAGFVKQQIRDAKSTLHNRRSLVWMGAKEGAGFLFGPLGTGLGVMEQAMKDGSAPARVLSATLLAQQGDARAIADLEDALYDKSPLVRTAAAKLLGGFNDPTVPPKLAPILEDKIDAVRYMAAASIVRIDSNKGKGRGRRAKSKT